jgi:NAD(P)-dependent dehydrogenase (short-subunit alcohol dehydrogenase family)
MSDAQIFTSKLRNKRVLIIGGSSGVGLAVAQGCMESDAHVTIFSNPSRIGSTIKNHP